MAHTRRSLMLDEDWDITLDGIGRIALAKDEYATAQNVGNEARLFTNDAYFRQADGIPHFDVELGQKFSESIVLRAYLLRAAGRVEDVNEVLEVNIETFDPATRQLSGSILFNTVGGNIREAITTYF